MKLYEKIIDGKQHCKPANKIIIIKDGMQTFNPTEEMLLEDGWQNTYQYNMNQLKKKFSIEKKNTRLTRFLGMTLQMKLMVSTLMTKNYGLIRQQEQVLSLDLMQRQRVERLILQYGMKVLHLIQNLLMHYRCLMILNYMLLRVMTILKGIQQVSIRLRILRH